MLRYLCDYSFNKNLCILIWSPRDILESWFNDLVENIIELEFICSHLGTLKTVNHTYKEKKVVIFQKSTVNA